MPTKMPDEAVDRSINLKLALQGKSTGELKKIIIAQAERIILYRAQLEKMIAVVDGIRELNDHNQGP